MSIRLIVNADDFGYFEGVSRGILEAIDSGVVTATGVMANGPALARTVGPLKAMSSVSVGVHLNATLGAPVTEPMRLALAAWMGVDPSAVRFPSKGRMARGLLGGAIPTETLLTEWSAQIGRCQELGLSLDFVNSHEHLHMRPCTRACGRWLGRTVSVVCAPRERSGDTGVPRPAWCAPPRSASRRRLDQDRPGMNLNWSDSPPAVGSISTTSDGVCRDCSTAGFMS
jgi:predicted glycoside hydrolase/deacetylase ChbG (UPF0249 family)